MKKVIMCLVFLGAVLVGNQVQAQQRQNERRYYYYPQSNVYYDPVNRQYIYPENNNNWTTVQRLPSNINVQGTRRVIVYSNSPEVWQMNAQHREKYRYYNGNYQNGKGRKYKKGDRDRDRDRDGDRDDDRH